MIEFNYETTFALKNEKDYSNWIAAVILSENKTIGEINFVFCDDQYLLNINQEHLKHDYYTDIISFDYSLGNQMSGDLFVSVDRIKENAADFNVSFDQELKRVLVHGILHFCGYNDKLDHEVVVMRNVEDQKIAMFAAETPL